MIFRKKVYECPDFLIVLHMSGPNCLTSMYMLTFSEPLFSHLHTAGFLMTRIIYKLPNISQGILIQRTVYEKVNFLLNQVYMNMLFFFSKTRYMIGVGFKILARTPEP